jgi:pSer/pThr/pTyr-binding forkhead associated (FHA) protein
VIRKLVISNGRSERELLLVGNIIVGRDPACHVSDPDPLLSRRHAEIVANVHGVSVRDLDSRNGILVNGEKTREQVLLPGDVVQLGHLQLRYVEENARAADGLASRGLDRRQPAPAGPPAPSFDRFRPEQSSQPGRWKPEPTPLPGRRSSSPPPAAPTQPAPPAAPRGRAAFDQSAPGSRAPQRTPEQFDDTMLAYPGAHDTTLGAGQADPEATVLTPMPVLPRERQAAAGAVPAAGDTTVSPGDATFAAALSQLAGFAQSPPVEEPADPRPRLVANAELTVVEATAACAQLLGVGRDELIGDSLPDVFLRGVRRAYADPASALTLSITRDTRGRDTRGLIVVTFSAERRTDR